jgi:hypothetical protein
MPAVLFLVRSSVASYRLHKMTLKSDRDVVVRDQSVYKGVGL